MSNSKQLIVDRFRQFYYRNDLSRWVLFGLIIIVTGFILSPIYWMVRIAFTPEFQIFVVPPKSILETATTRAFELLFTKRAYFFIYYLNSIIVSSATTVVCLVSGLLAAYSFSRFRYIGRNLFMQTLLSSQMFPWALLLIPLFISFSKLGLINTYTGLVIAHATFAFPLCTWILKSYFDTIPRELEESAEMDGCGKLRILWSIVLPVCLPGIVAAGIYVFLFSWNDFLFGLTLTNKQNMRILAPGLSLTFVEQHRYNWTEMMAACVVITIPLVVVFLFLQRYFIQGLTAGAMKE